MIKRFFAVSALILLTVCNLVAQESPLLLTIDTDSIYLDEFERIYKKNNSNPDLSDEALDEYLGLFVNYKLKVKEAERLGYDTAATFLRELEGYKKQLAKPYLEDNTVTEELINEAYERLKEEIRASHILIKKGTDDNPVDTAVAYRKIKDIRKRALKGEDFGYLAKEYSQDQSAAQNRGDLGYFSALQMVYPFENEAYNTPVGKVSNIIQTRFGYHILKVTDRRPSMGSVKVAHILVREYPGDPASLKVSNEQKANQIYDRIKAGETFEDMARRYSDDKTTSDKGGVLPTFGSGRMVEEFENAAFALENPGDISKPFKTSYGWHIVKLIEKQGLRSLDILKDELFTKVKGDSRSLSVKKSFVNKLKDEYNFKAYEKNAKAVAKYLTKDFFNGTWEIPNKKLDKPVLTWDGNERTQRDFLEFIKSNMIADAQVVPFDYVVDFRFNEYKDRAIFDYEKAHLADKYPEYAHLMQEYYEGILLFNVTNDKVWEKSLIDTTGLENFYKENILKYQWDNRLKGVLYKSEDQKLAKKAKTLAKKKYKDYILKTLNVDNALNIVAENLTVEKGANEIVDLFDWKGKPVQGPIKQGDFFYVFQIEEKLPARSKEISEAKGQITADYQTYLETTWMKELHSRYKVTIKKPVLKNLQP